MEKYITLLKNIETLLQEVREEFDVKMKELATEKASLEGLKKEKEELAILKSQLDEQQRLIESEKIIDQERKLTLEQKEKEVRQHAEHIQSILNR